MVESSPPDAKYSPDGDHLTILTGLMCRVKSDARFNCSRPSSFSSIYQIYFKQFNPGEREKEREKK